MKFSISKTVALAIIGSASVVGLAATPYFAANATEQSSMPQDHPHGPAPGGPMHGPMRGPMRGPFLMAVRRLNLTPEQQQSVHSIMESARQQHQSQMSVGYPDMAVLGNPGDTAYPAAVQKAKADAAKQIQQHSDLDVQIYAVLTGEQKAKLPQVLADMQAKVQQHHQHGAQKHAPAIAQ